MIIEALLLILAVPVGFLIAYLTKEELVSGRIWFRTIFIASIALGLLAYPFGFRHITWTCLFIAIVALISLMKSKDKKWMKKKF